VKHYFVSATLELCVADTYHVEMAVFKLFADMGLPTVK
jgi:hypothetical protein